MDERHQPIGMRLFVSNFIGVRIVENTVYLRIIGIKKKGTSERITNAHILFSPKTM